MLATVDLDVAIVISGYGDAERCGRKKLVDSSVYIYDTFASCLPYYLLDLEPHSQMLTSPTNSSLSHVALAGDQENIPYPGSPPLNPKRMLSSMSASRGAQSFSFSPGNYGLEPRRLACDYGEEQKGSNKRIVGYIGPVNYRPPRSLVLQTAPLTKPAHNQWHHIRVEVTHDITRMTVVQSQLLPIPAQIRTILPSRQQHPRRR
ncbi:hypothetical protein A0H81_07847 [Grifola frondosa]|uniref:Uncharacterized protein n=1 Tax=Grifola frondosa TaxID=5627 RepID=A0A1C7M7K5_GRIFR|nr:hypothetical protein A0H81_07847 [Grifola frondosa]